jgi:hypothetical protein
MQGIGAQQIEQRRKTESKIVAFLNLQPCPYNELHVISGINRNSLKIRLDALIDRNIVTIIRNPTGARKGKYYKLNKCRKETKQLLDDYYNEPKPPVSKELKQQVLTALKNYKKMVEVESGRVMANIDTFKNEIEPLLTEYEPDQSLDEWFKSLVHVRYSAQLETKMLKLFAVKLRLRLNSTLP